jgi:hypothetical protein
MRPRVGLTAAAWHWPIGAFARLQNVSTTGVDSGEFVRTREHYSRGDKDSKTLGRKGLRCLVVRNCGRVSSNLCEWPTTAAWLARQPSALRHEGRSSIAIGSTRCCASTAISDGCHRPLQVQSLRLDSCPRLGDAVTEKRLGHARIEHERVQDVVLMDEMRFHAHVTFR